MKQEPKYVAETLEWCNERRKEQGKEPLKRMPKGELQDPRSCPCGKAASLSVGHDHWAVLPKSYFESSAIALPTCVREFVRAFDAGKLPQYIE